MRLYLFYFIFWNKGWLIDSQVLLNKDVSVQSACEQCPHFFLTPKLLTHFQVALKNKQQSNDLQPQLIFLLLLLTMWLFEVSGLWHQQGIFLHTTAVHWIFFLFQSSSVTPSDGRASLKIPVDQQSVKPVSLKLHPKSLKSPFCSGSDCQFKLYRAVFAAAACLSAQLQQCDWMISCLS